MIRYLIKDQLFNIPHILLFLENFLLLPQLNKCVCISRYELECFFKEMLIEVAHSKGHYGEHWLGNILVKESRRK